MSDMFCYLGTDPRADQQGRYHPGAPGSRQNIHRHQDCPDPPQPGPPFLPSYPGDHVQEPRSGRVPEGPHQLRSVLCVPDLQVSSHLHHFVGGGTHKVLSLMAEDGGISQRRLSYSCSKIRLSCRGLYAKKCTMSYVSKSEVVI